MAIFHKSNLAHDVFQKHGGTKELSLDVKTRWSSTELMLSSLLLKQDAVTKAYADPLLQHSKALEKVSVTNMEWGKIRELQALLAPFSEALKELCGQEYVTLPNVLPALGYFREILEIARSDSAFLVRVKRAVSESIEKYFGEAAVDNFAHGFCRMAAYLDPSSKHLIKSKTGKELVWDEVKVMYDAVASDVAMAEEALPAQEPVDVPPAAKVARSFSEFKSKGRTGQSVARTASIGGERFAGLRMEFDLYEKLCENFNGTSDNAISFWCKKSEVLPSLAKVAKVNFN